MNDLGDAANGKLTDDGPSGGASPGVEPEPAEASGGSISESEPSGQCARCGAGLPADVGNRCPSCGSWTPGNLGAFKTGLTSAAARRQLLDGPSAVALAEQRAEIETDLGGPEALSRIQRDLIGRYVETASMASWLAGNLVADGVLTVRGRARQALNAYLQILDRQHRLGLALGLVRQPKRLPSLVEYLNERDSQRSASSEETA